MKRFVVTLVIINATRSLHWEHTGTRLTKLWLMRKWKLLTSVKPVTTVAPRKILCSCIFKDVTQTQQSLHWRVLLAHSGSILSDNTNQQKTKTDFYLLNAIICAQKQKCLQCKSTGNMMTFSPKLIRNAFSASIHAQQENCWQFTRSKT